ncbi:hypothetical protein [Salinisphaera sp. G21_0]|uniref:hypothetical protein n=1 Tax=Salinisphaera sp. G21_0 TaxID=2821094 RepID=UPI0025706DA0|nr:hypothetical protein [Salinisphaera sp. G21_0]
MVRALDRNNLIRALKQVQRNKGAAGVDGMTVDELPHFLKQYWPIIRQQLIEGVYRPKPVLRVEIPKPDGRKSKLGIPTVLDRLIQQAIAQIMQAEWDSITTVMVSVSIGMHIRLSAMYSQLYGMDITGLWTVILRRSLIM